MLELCKLLQIDNLNTTVYKTEH